jgi:hypothetical protein
MKTTANTHPAAKLIMMASTALALAMLALPAHAFGLQGGGGQVGSLDPEHGDMGLALGAHLDMEQAGTHWHLKPNVLYWNSDPEHGFDGNVDAFYHFNAQKKTGPYLGGGLGVAVVDHEITGTETNGAANVIGGMLFPSGVRNNLFLEGRYTASQVQQASISLGMTLR